MLKNITLITLLGAACSLFAKTAPVLQKPFYLGVNGGFGSTTWQGLVPPQKKQNIVMNLATPIEVKEGGQVFGVFAGYELNQFFAIEAQYRHFPNATVIFDQYSLFAFKHDEHFSFCTDTETLSLMAKVMLSVPQTPLKLYSSFGIASVHRKDDITNQTKASPTFGAGFSINITSRVMVDLGFNYTAGYGEPELNPSDNYIPFLYSASLGFAYRV